jgi:two-component sensor histidine kinase
VGILSFAASAIIAVINAIVLVLDGTPVATVVFEPAVLFILAIALMFLVSALKDSGLLRGIQILAYVTAAIFTAAGEEPGNLTGFLFAIFAVLLFNEYGEPGKRFKPSVVFAVGYVLLSTLLAERVGWALAVSVFVFVSGVVTMYGLVVYRQLTIRRNYERDLEARIEERTTELRETANTLRRTVEDRDQALHQRNLLIQEIHHRVGNSLQILASYVSMQADTASTVADQVMKETELRIQAIAEVHGTLYSLQQFSHLPLDDYARELCFDIERAYEGSVSLETEINTDTSAHIDFVMSFGIALNELMTNSVKHGQSDSGVAEIQVRLFVRAGQLHVAVSDHGPGFPDRIERKLGTEVIDGLFEQIGGQIRRFNQGGAVVEAVFPMARVLNNDRLRRLATGYPPANRIEHSLRGWHA